MLAPPPCCIIIRSSGHFNKVNVTPIDGDMKLKMAFARIFSHPVVRASMTSCTVMACGDLLCQSIRARGTGRKLQLDFRQTARFALIGATLHGPFFWAGFRWLDTRIGPAATLPKALVKTALGQVTLFPVYSATFFTYMGLLEGLTPRQLSVKLRQSLPPALATGTLFWPTVNIFNFMLVPPAGRILYVNFCGLFWNAFLSWANTTYGTTVKPKAAAIQGS